jgi:hypothetical protein
MFTLALSTRRYSFSLFLDDAEGFRLFAAHRRQRASQPEGIAHRTGAAAAIGVAGHGRPLAGVVRGVHGDVVRNRQVGEDLRDIVDRGVVVFRNRMRLDERVEADEIGPKFADGCFSTRRPCGQAQGGPCC